MKVKRVQYLNFGSYGNKLQDLEFTENNFYLIDGKNGGGKSTISNVIKFAIYGKLNGKKLGDIPNRINKNCWSKVWLISKGKELIIERALEPNFFKLYINGVEYDQAGKKTVQKYLEEELLELPFSVFDNTLLISIKDFKSFLNMSPGEKRAIIDRIFSLNVFNEMRTLLKKEMSEINDVVNLNKKEILLLSKSITSTEREIEFLTAKQQDFSESEIERLNIELVKFVDLLKLILEKYNLLKTNTVSIDESLFKLSKFSEGIKAEMRSLDAKIKLYENDKCPHCESNLNDTQHITLKDSFIEEKDKKSELLIENVKEEKQLFAEKTKLVDEITLVQEKYNKCKVKIKQIEEKISELGIPNSDELLSLVKLKDNFDNQISDLNETVIFKDKESKFLNLVDEVIGEDGVKKIIVKNMLPIFNKEVNKMLQKMSMDYMIHFDEELNPVITEFGIPISVETLSGGEGIKSDFVVLIAILKMLKLKYNNINMLFLDEIFAYMDSEAMYEVSHILKSMVTELGLNIFVIHHAQLPTEVFDKIISVHKKNKFSELSIKSL